MPAAQAPMPDRLLTARQVSEKVAFCEKTIYRRLKRGLFPAPVRMDGAVRWRQTDVDAWIAALPYAHDLVRPE